MEINSPTLKARTAASVPTPEAGTVTLFVDSATGNASQKNDAGTVLDLGAAGGGGGGGGGGSLFTNVANGIVPASGGGKENYLRADGTWASPRSSRRKFRAVGTGFTAVSAEGSTWTATGTGTAATNATTNLHTATTRTEYLVTTAAATAVSGVRMSVAQYTIGSTFANMGGFDITAIWGPATGVATATHRGFCGVQSSVAAPTDVEPSTITNSIGFGWDAADTTIQLMHRGTGAVTKISTGIAVPITDRANIYKCTFSQPQGATQSVTCTLTNQITGAAFTQTVTTNLPASTVFMGFRVWASVGGTSSVVGIAVMDISGEYDVG